MSSQISIDSISFPTIQQLHRTSLLMLVITVMLCLGLARISGDAAVYALLAKHMVLQSDWINLFFQGADWLDKPHFPFWMMALSFKVFGVTIAAYHIPGLLFYAMGAWFTMRLAQYFYNDKVAALSLLLYLSVLGLLLGAADQKAEVYLLGLLTAASYAWLRYADKPTFATWLLGSVCTGCALMTKGIFLLFVLGVGLLAIIVYRRAWSQLWHWKWGLAVLGSALFVLPELIALYMQFDAHPEKIVHDHTNVSGIRFFFWDSQFGRILNTGPIRSDDGSPWFFIHNLAWTFFPWIVVLTLALYHAARSVIFKTTARAVESIERHREGTVFLCATFLATFALFSLSKYQMDYYLIIVFPYATILCAKWLCDRDWQATHRSWWYRLHLGLSLLLLVIALICIIVFFRDSPYRWLLLVFLALPILWRWLSRSPISTQALAWPVISVFFTALFAQFYHYDLFEKYDIGPKVASFLKTKPKHPVYVYGRALKSMDLLTDFPNVPVWNTDDLIAKLNPNLNPSADSQVSNLFYLVVPQSMANGVLTQIGQQLRLSVQAEVVQHFDETIISPLFLHKLLGRSQTLAHQDVAVYRVQLDRAGTR